MAEVVFDASEVEAVLNAVEVEVVLDATEVERTLDVNGIHGLLGGGGGEEPEVADMREVQATDRPCVDGEVG